MVTYITYTFPDYGNDIQDRLASFKNWPENHPIKAEDLADAGFIFTGMSFEYSILKNSNLKTLLLGRVESGMFCYKCRITVRNWNDSDDPWIRHAQSNLQCPHIERTKGQDFLDYIREMLNKNNDEVDSSSKSKELIEEKVIVSQLIFKLMCASHRGKTRVWL